MYALILAGGEGQRLRPLTDDRPKNMVNVAGKPIIDWQLEWLANNGVSDVVLLTGYKSEVLEAYLGDGSRFGIRATYSKEEEPLGRGGAIKAGYKLVPPDEEFIIAINGDNLQRQEIKPIIAFHQENTAMATVMLSPLKSQYGIAEVASDGRITAFREKPELPYWVNAGVYILNREFFSLLPDRGDHETTLFPVLEERGLLYGFQSRAYWRPVDSLKDLAEAERELATVD